jgi:hypothetical protein
LAVAVLVSACRHEMPGFAVSFVVTASSASQAIEAHADDPALPVSRELTKRLTERLDSEEVDIVGGVGQIFIAAATVATGGVESVTAAEGIGSGYRFHLDSPQTLAGIEDEIIAFTVSIGFRDTKSRSHRWYKPPSRANEITLARPRARVLLFGVSLFNAK